MYVKEKSGLGVKSGKGNKQKLPPIETFRSGRCLRHLSFLCLSLSLSPPPLCLTLILLLSSCMKCVDALLVILVETGIQFSGVDSLSTMGSRDGIHITKLLVLLSQGTRFLWQYFDSIIGSVSAASYFCWYVSETKWNWKEMGNRIDASKISSFSCWVGLLFVSWTFLKVLWIIFEYLSSNASVTLRTYLREITAFFFTIDI